jgi:phage tail sheath protein FI
MTMAQVSYPGVYVEEVPSGVHTITAVSTSIGAFLGRASKGPINVATRLLSYADYEREFGAPHDRSDLADSVRMFFTNGGTDCYVVRLAKDAIAASVTLENLAGDTILVATAKAEGVWGNRVRLEVDYNTPTPDETFNLAVLYEDEEGTVHVENHIGLNMNPNSARFAPDFVTQSSQYINLAIDEANWGGAGYPDLSNLTYSFEGFSSGRRPLGTAAADVQTLLYGLIDTDGLTSFQISVDESSFRMVILEATDVPASATLAAMASNIETKINDALLADGVTVTVAFRSIGASGNVLEIAADTTSPGAINESVRVRTAPSNDIAKSLMLGVDQGGIEPTRFSNFRPAPTASIIRLGDPSNLGSIADADTMAQIEQDDITAIEIGGTVVGLVGDFTLQTSGVTDPWHKNAAGDSPLTDDNDGVREKLKIIESAINANAALDYRAEVWGYTLAIKATSGTLNQTPSAIASTPTGTLDTMDIVNVRQYALGDGGSGAFSIDGDVGHDGNPPEYDQYIGSEANQTGFHALDPVDLLNLMVLPGDQDVPESTMATLWGPASNYCQKRRAFLLIDPPNAWTDNATGRPEVTQDTSLINTLRASIVKDHAAVFYPRLRFNDGGLVRTIGPAGAIAGLMARTDSTRGVWKAPAGIEAGVRDIVGLNIQLTDLENGVLNKKGVNCIRLFPSGFVNWGARTLDGDDDFGSEWKYIPVRRLGLMLAESLYRGTRWAVFKPNDEPLWANIRMNIGAFMFSLFRQGAFQGTSPKEAYYVKCDKETTTQDDRNKGIVNIEVGFAPLKPAEFVVIKIQQMAGEL